MTIVTDQDLCTFLLEAKQNTYAAQDNEATVANLLLPGSVQLEWCSGEFVYRDIYFGRSLFTGQETVYRNNVPVWSMAYSGGVSGEREQCATREIYAFLRCALMLVPADQPFRGPREFTSGVFDYAMTINGSTDRFEGRESILENGSDCYALVFAGGRVA